MTIKTKRQTAIGLILIQCILTIILPRYFAAKTSILFDLEGNLILSMHSIIAMALVPIISIVYYLYYTRIIKLSVYKKNILENIRIIEAIGLSRIIFLTIHQLAIAFRAMEFVNSIIISYIAFVIILFYYGEMIRKTTRSFFIGIKTPWTLTDEVSWERTNLLGGDLFMGFAILMFFNLLLEQFWLYTLIIPLIALYIFLYYYSYTIHKKELEKHY